MLSSIKHRIILLLQLLIVITYLIFEELIWEGIAKPVYGYVHSLRIMQKVETRLQAFNAHIILFLFVIIFAVVQLIGLYAGLLFMSGQILLGMIVYVTKIPLAAFTFWVFRVTEEKLMTFGWFKWVYEKIMALIAWVKSREIYLKTMDRLMQVKVKIKKFSGEIKEKYFSQKSPFMEKIKSLYRTMKDSIRR
jgi:hypothetical protein